MKIYNNGSNLETIKVNNRSLVLRVLNTLGQATRVELSKITGLTKTSITNITSELLEAGVIYETGTVDSSAGRKPTLLKISDNASYSIGVYISRDFVYTNIVNLKGNIINEYTHQFDFAENEDKFLSLICSNITNVLEASQINSEKILGVGIASIGPLDIVNGIILDPPNFRGLKSIPIVNAVEEKLNLKAFLDNDMNAAAIAEKLFGNARSISNFIYIGVTNGLGAGIVINGNLFRGSNGFAGEIGHTTINFGGERCACGNTGCLELYANIPAVVNQVRSSIEHGAESLLTGKKDIVWTDIISAASNNDLLCLEAINKLAYYLSVGIVNAINSFDPEVVFLGHEIALAGGLVITPLNETINRGTIFREAKKVPIELSKFKDYAPRIGAASIVLDRFFNGELI